MKRNVIEVNPGIVRNKHGIGVRVICASCKYCQLDKGAMRICMKGAGRVDRTDWCDGWEIKERMDKVGEGSGRVLKKHYIMYLSQWANYFVTKHENERYTTEQFCSFLEQHKLKYEQLYGSKYMNI